VIKKSNSKYVKTLLGIITAILISACQIFAANDYEVQKITEDVYAVIRHDPPSLWFNPNTTFIIGKKDVIVIDSNISSEYTRQVLAELRKITKKSVRYVINTHWHEDHIIGNHVYKDAFPNVEFIGHRSTLKDLPEIGGANRKWTLENGAGFVKALKNAIETNKDFAGQTMTEEEKLGYAGDIKFVQSYLDESPNFQIILPTVLVDEKLELNDGKRKIEVLFLGKAHTGGDLVVRLPKENIVISGDLTVYPIPLVGSTSYPLEYGATLESLLKLKAKTIIPSHGFVMHDDSYIKLMIRLLNSLKEQSEAAFPKSKTLAEFRKNIDLKEFRKAFTGDSRHKSFIFENYVFLSATAAAYKQLSEKNK
jgi:glyoxylase-like metal-dependent hydrolase (beta-lactamase superfamily II)